VEVDVAVIPDVRLARARSANHRGSSVAHTVVVLPSYSVGPSLLARYGERIAALEHRQLLTMLMLPLVPGSEIVFVTAKHPTEAVLEYYLSLMPEEVRGSVRGRLRVVEVPDTSPRSITAKLLERPDLMAEIRSMTRGRLAFIEPWNVTHLEMDVARELGLPLNGTPAHLWPLGFKSRGRELMRSAGVPLAAGREGVRSVAEVVAAADDVKQQHPAAVGVVIKLDNSGTGDGNRVIRFADAGSAASMQATVESLEPWYLSELEEGAVVEELITGQQLSNPSVQVDIAPGRRVRTVSTHEQLLGGSTGQEYLGCRFPADPGYRRQLTWYGQAVGKKLAKYGAMGRFCVDFVAARAEGSGWRVHGLEINLRKSGTSHPFSLLHNLVPGQYDPVTGGWSGADGSERCYRSTDSLVDPAWRGRPADEVISAVRSAGLELDPRTGVGSVLHMLVGLDIDGRIGLTTIGRSPHHAERLHEETVAALRRPGIASSTRSDPDLTRVG
jgi:hypothetical protein